MTGGTFAPTVQQIVDLLVQLGPAGCRGGSRLPGRSRLPGPVTAGERSPPTSTAAARSHAPLKPRPRRPRQSTAATAVKGGHSRPRRGGRSPPQVQQIVDLLAQPGPASGPATALTFWSNAGARRRRATGFFFFFSRPGRLGQTEAGSAVTASKGQLREGPATAGQGRLQRATSQRRFGTPILNHY